MVYVRCRVANKQARRRAALLRAKLPLALAHGSGPVALQELQDSAVDADGGLDLDVYTYMYIFANTNVFNVYMYLYV